MGVNVTASRPDVVALCLIQTGHVWVCGQASPSKICLVSARTNGDCILSWETATQAAVVPRSLAFIAEMHDLPVYELDCDLGCKIFQPAHTYLASLTIVVRILFCQPRQHFSNCKVS